MSYCIYKIKQQLQQRMQESLDVSQSYVNFKLERQLQSIQENKSSFDQQQKPLNKLMGQLIPRQSKGRGLTIQITGNKRQMNLEMDLNNPEDRALQLALRMNRMRMQKQRRVQAQLERYKLMKGQFNNSKDLINSISKSPHSILPHPKNIQTRRTLKNPKIQQEVQLLRKSILLNQRNHIKKFLRQILLQIVTNAVDRLEKKKAFYFHKSPKFVNKNITIKNIRPNQYGPNNFNTIQHENHRSLKLKKVKANNERFKYEFEEFTQYKIQPSFLNNSFRARVLKQLKQKKKQKQQQVLRMHQMRQKINHYNYYNLLKSKVADKKIDDCIYSIVVSDPSHKKVSEEFVKQIFGIKKGKDFKVSSQYGMDIGLTLVTLQQKIKKQQEQVESRKNSLASQKQSMTIIDGNLSNVWSTVGKDIRNQNQFIQQSPIDNSEIHHQSQNIEKQRPQSQPKSRKTSIEKHQQLQIQQTDRNGKLSQFSFQVRQKNNKLVKQLQIGLQDNYEKQEYPKFHQTCSQKQQQEKEKHKWFYEQKSQHKVTKQRQIFSIKSKQQSINSISQRSFSTIKYKQQNSFVEQSELQEVQCYSDQIKLSRFLQPNSDQQMDFRLTNQLKINLQVQ